MCRGCLSRPARAEGLAVGAVQVASNNADVARRSYGTGQLFVKRDARGREHWYARFYVGGRRPKRRVGLKRGAGSSDGLTRTQAEKKLRGLMESESLAVAADNRVAIRPAGERYLGQLETVMGRKPSTIADYRYMLAGHMIPFFGERKLDRIDADLVGDYMACKRREGLAPKTVANHMRFLHGLFSFAVKRGWMTQNLVAWIDRPPSAGPDPDIRFLEVHELEAMIREIDENDKFASTDCAIYLTAAMTGLRQGELIALRWQDVDWPAGRLRVRRNYVRGEWGTPKSQAIEPRRADGRPRRARARAPLQRNPPTRQMRISSCSPRERKRARRLGAAQALRQGAEGRRPTAGAVSRLASHVRHADGGGGCADAHASGVDGPSRHSDDNDLRRLRAEHP